MESTVVCTNPKSRVRCAELTHQLLSEAVLQSFGERARADLLAANQVSERAGLLTTDFGELEFA
jgi:hypothetical protein